MGRLSVYNIPLKDLPVGSHKYEFKLAQDYFDALDEDLVKKGAVDAIVVVKKNSQTFDISFELKGMVQVPCDRCLEDMDQEIDTTGELVVKFGKEYAEESDKVVIIPEEEGEINLAWFMYEFIALAIPIRHVHPAGKCSKSMVSKLRKHLTRTSDDEYDDFDSFEFDDEEIEEDQEKEIDPRWDGLKKLLEEDNNN